MADAETTDTAETEATPAVVPDIAPVIEPVIEHVVTVLKADVERVAADVAGGLHRLVGEFESLDRAAVAEVHALASELAAKLRHVRAAV